MSFSPSMKHESELDSAISPKLPNDDHVSLDQYLLKLCKERREEIYELSRENGYPLNKKRFSKWKLRAALVKPITFASDNKLCTSLSKHYYSKYYLSHEKRPKHDDFNLADTCFYYLDIQISDTETIHVRIFSKNDCREQVQAILYKKVDDKLHQF